uniref:Uncharacterized protein n=1 Tax=Arundo donax TaxID=35708 RepID=A0A0A9G8Z2_ARUDO
MFHCSIYLDFTIFCMTEVELRSKPLFGVWNDYSW